MNSTTKQVASIAFTFMLVASVFSVAQLGAAATGDPTSFKVTQGEDCWDVSTRGDGTTSVSDYYDYRNPDNSEGTGNFTYSSWGTQDLQENQVSQLFLYNGSDGVSLVIIHDKLNQSDDAPYGSTVTFNITGLPSDGDWAVQDDEYDGQDDEWNETETSADINWKWQDNRTDGGAHTGLESGEFEALTINPGFNEDAEAWGDWDYSGGEHRISDWKFVDADDSKTELNMSQSVTIAQGSCEVEEPPTDDPTENETETPTENETETPTPTTEEPTENETETEEPTPTTEEPKPTTEKPTEEPDEKPTVNLVVKNEGKVGENSHVYASASDDKGIVKYHWFPEGKDDYHKPDKRNIYPTYQKPGKYTIKVTVTDTSGQTATDRVTLHVKDKPKPKPTPDDPKETPDDPKDGDDSKDDEDDDKSKNHGGSSTDGNAYQSSDDEKTSEEEDSSDGAYQGSDETEEAVFEVLDLEVDTDRIVAGDTVKLNGTITNTGNADGSFTGDLLMDETVLTSETVDVAAGETKDVTFTYTFDEPGEYTLTVEGLTKTFEVHEPTESTAEQTEEALQNEQTSETESTDGPGQPGFGIVAALLALVSAALLAIRRG